MTFIDESRMEIERFKLFLPFSLFPKSWVVKSKKKEKEKEIIKSTMVLGNYFIPLLLKERRIYRQ